jgi:hypothetical protein
MPLEVVNRHRRNLQRVGQAPGDRAADEERADEPGARRVGDAVQVRELEPGLPQDLPDEGEYLPDVVARREFRDDAAVLDVHVHLAV